MYDIALYERKHSVGLEVDECIESYEDDGKIYRIYEFNNLKIWLNR